MTEEAIRAADLKPLSLWLAGQPAWSDLPFVLVTDHGGGPERNPIAGAGSRHWATCRSSNVLSIRRRC